MSTEVLNGNDYKTSLKQRLINRAYHDRFHFEVYDTNDVVVKVCGRKERAELFCNNNDGFTFKRVNKLT
jgi:hypothetical protein